MSFIKEYKKMRARLLQPLATRIQRSPKNLSQEALVMTLLVRNEQDIIRENIEFHLKMGVDYIFATDNGSTDETRAILLEYQEKNCLTLIDEPKQDYAQSTWVNRMADMAFEKFGSCLIFHCDADEFWYSKSGNLKNELARLPLIECLNVHITNVLPIHKDFSERFPDDLILHIQNPFETTNLREDSKETSLYLFPYPDKVFYRAKKHMPHVDMGNHVLMDRKTYISKVSEDVLVLHMPVRSYNHFQCKVVEGGSAIVSNPNLAPGFGWHWRRWYQDHQDGKLRSTYRKLVLDSDEASAYEKQGVLKIDMNIPRLIKGTFSEQ